MKLKKSTLLPLVFGLTMIACNPNNKNSADKKSKVSKNTIIAKQEEITFLYRADTKNRKEDTIKAKKDAPVSFTFDYPGDIPYGVIREPQTQTNIILYLKNGKSNTVTVDSISKDKKLHYRFTGDNASINHYLSLDKNQQKKLGTSINGEYDAFKSDVTAYIKSRKAELDSVKDNDFKKQETTSLAYYDKTLKVIYALRKVIIKKTKIDSINPELIKLINEKPIEDAKLLTLEKYKVYLNMMFQINFYKKDPEKMNSIVDAIKFLPNYFSNSTIIGNIGEGFVSSYLFRTQSTENDQAIKAFVNKYITDKDKKNKFLDDLKKRVAFKTGNAAPAFSGVDINGKKVTNEDFKGKYVIMEVWATWCSYCKKEEPFLTKLADKYKDNDKVKFVSISIDKKKKDWDDFIKKNNHYWSNLWIGKGFSNTVVNDYKIKGIPYFAVIDPKGNFALSPGKDTSTPSKDLEKNLEKLLSK